MIHNDSFNFENEMLDPHVAVRTIAVCIQYFTAMTVDACSSVEREVESLMLQRHESHDALLVLYNSILESVRTNALLLREAELWGETFYGKALAINIEPTHWRVDLKVRATTKKIDIQRAWNMDTDEFEAMIKEIRS